METIKLTKRTKKGSLVKVPVRLDAKHGYIHLLDLPFQMKDEIKAALSEPKWDNDRRAWRVKDDTRTRFQLEAMSGGDPYTPWDKPIVEHEYDRPLMTHQRLMTDWFLTRRRCIIAGEMGVGKSLSLMEGIERGVGVIDWWYVAPKSGLEAVKLEFVKWGFKAQPELMTYDAVLSKMKKWNEGDHIPQGIVFDEFSRCKNARAQRTQACQFIADKMRELYGWDSYIIGASGSCAPKSPVDWWALCEIIAPGFLRENDYKTFEWRLGIHEKQEIGGTKFHKRVAWRDDSRRCNKCGQFEYVKELDEEGEWTGEFTDELTHVDEFGLPSKDHEWVESINEVALLPSRMEGLVLPIFKKDCLDLPELEYRTIELKASSSLKRAARAIAKSATSTIQALTWLRTLSDGFQYNIEETDELIKCQVCEGTGVYKDWEVDGEDDYDAWSSHAKVDSICETCGGEGKVFKSIREAKYYKGPKEKALRGLLEECEEHGRIVVFAGFKASVDLCMRTAHDEGWDVVRVDGRGWKIFRCDGERVRKTKPLEYWANSERKVAFVAHAESGGMGLTLTEAYMEVFYSNDFKPENRIQAVNRIHRPGMTRGGVIVDLIHLGTDRQVLDVLSDNHRLERMSIGDLRKALE